jgi:hypothetical protein
MLDRRREFGEQMVHVSQRVDNAYSLEDTQVFLSDSLDQNGNALAFKDVDEFRQRASAGGVDKLQLG